jgi:tetratricopeptide (TPR) repeat protein
MKLPREMLVGLAVIGCATAGAARIPEFASLRQPPGRLADATAERFDDRVRDDFFAALEGDKAAFDRAMRECESTLAKNPAHAQALVWHGNGLALSSREWFERGDYRQGNALWEKGLQEMDRALTLAPDSVGVLIPVGAALIGAGMHMPQQYAPPYLEKGVTAYEKVLQLQGESFGRLSVHSRGELLTALAEAEDRLGRSTEARAYYLRIADELARPGLPEYAMRARAWLDGKLVKNAAPHECVGCHTD